MQEGLPMQMHQDDIMRRLAIHSLPFSITVLTDQKQWARLGFFAGDKTGCPMNRLIICSPND